MRCGVLCDASGTIKRTWSLISDAVVIEPEAPGDEAIEWDVDHGGDDTDDLQRAEKSANVDAERKALGKMRTKDDAVRHKRDSEEKKKPQEQDGAKTTVRIRP